MTFNLQFVKKFVAVAFSAHELKERLTMAGLEVERLQQVADDWVFDVEITSNRYDWLSIVGIAREIAAITGTEFRLQTPAVARKPVLKEKNVIIEDAEGCPYYVGRLIQNVRVLPSQGSVAAFITRCGLNPVNAVVDCTNYSMLTWGNPLHAFDYDKIEGPVIVRRAHPGETFVGIDKKARNLTRENLVIADAKKVIALAGVMGAANTEVDATTRNIFLEAALFSPVTVRVSRRRAGIDTDSSYRFERSVSPEYLEYASQEACDAIVSASGGTFAGIVCAGKRPPVKAKTIVLKPEALDAYLGTHSKPADIKRVLTHLGCKVKSSSKSALAVTVPSIRFDLKREVDLYEEFARINGFDTIPASLGLLSGHRDDPYLLQHEQTYTIKNELRNFLAMAGFNEIITYSIENDEELRRTTGCESIAICNPLRMQENAMRTTLLVGMAQCVRHNLNRNQNNLNLFELADLYWRNNRGFKEQPFLALGVSGETERFFVLKRAVEELLRECGVTEARFEEESIKNFTSALVVKKDGVRIGFLGKLDEGARKEFDITEPFFFAQFDVTLLMQQGMQKRYRPFSTYPVLWRDISLMVRNTIRFAEIERIIRDGNEHLAHLRVVDTYRGKGLPADSTAFTVRIFYQARTRTLTADEVDKFHEALRSRLSSREGIVLR